MPAEEVSISVLPRLFSIVDVSGDDPDELVSERLALLPELAAAGVDGFQVRAKGLPDPDALGLAELVVRSVRPVGAIVVVNDRVDIALASGADGVHLGAEDLPVATARRVAPGLLIGGTCRDPEGVARAADEGADYCGFGPVATTTSKDGLPAPRGVDAIGRAAGDLPLVAIGGVDVEVARDARAAGAHGVAVIGAIWRDPDPIRAAKELATAVA